MGLDIRLHNIVSANPFTLSYLTGEYFTNPNSGFTSYSVGSNLSGGRYYTSTTGTTSGTLRNYNTNPIIFTGASFDTQYWFKITDSVTSGYTIANIRTHEICYYPCANCGTLEVNLECITPTPTPTPTLDCGVLTVNLECITPTPTPGPTSTPSPTNTPSPTATSTPTPTNTPTPTPTNTPVTSLTVYGRDIAAIPDTITMTYTINGGFPFDLVASSPLTNSCVGLGIISPLSNGDSVEITTTNNYLINGTTGTVCPASGGGSTTYTYVVSTGSNTIALTINTDIIP